MVTDNDRRGAAGGSSTLDGRVDTSPAGVASRPLSVHSISAIKCQSGNPADTMNGQTTDRSPPGLEVDRGRRATVSNGTRGRLEGNCGSRGTDGCLPKSLALDTSLLNLKTICTPPYITK